MSQELIGEGVDAVEFEGVEGAGGEVEDQGFVDEHEADVVGEDCSGGGFGERAGCGGVGGVDDETFSGGHGLYAGGGEVIQDAIEVAGRSEPDDRPG